MKLRKLKRAPHADKCPSREHVAHGSPGSRAANGDSVERC